MAPADAGFEKLASGVYLEGLAVDHQRGSVWYSDVIGGGVHGLTPDGGTAVLNAGRMWTGGILVNHDGKVLSSGEGGIMWNDPASGASGWLLDRLDGAAINGINEMVPDGAGGLYFGTTDLENVIKGEAPRPTAIWRLTAERQAIKLAEPIGFTNGLAFDPERRRLYCNDTFTGTWVFDVAGDLTLANRRLFVEKEDADGLALDAAGNVWVTGFRSNFLARFAPDGAALEPVSVPPGSVTQIRFAGPDSRDLYLTSVPAEGGDSLKDGVALTEQNSHLYRGRSAVAGRLVPAVRFDLAT